jgi:2-keto-4-pentenoate hydratase/2-oxohepta-3-ene-1,7-dioic acid hydratase in catechol pathway
MQDSTIWLGRVVPADRPHARPLSILVPSAGEVPGPDARVYVIDDPFVDPFADVHAIVAQNVDRVQHEAAMATLRELVTTHHFAPPCLPRKVIGVGRNYRAHAEELGNDVPTSPLLFLKPSSCLIGSGQSIALPRDIGRIDIEAELVCVIGRRAKGLAREEALSCVLGYSLGNDLSARVLQKEEPQWARAKGMDGFGPLGPWIRVCAPGFEIPAASMKICGKLGDKEVQRASVADMIFDVATLVSVISDSFTLEPGDIIYTGTPQGVTPLAPNQSCEVYTEGFELGRLTNVLL